MSASDASSVLKVTYVSKKFGDFTAVDANDLGL